MRLVDNINEQLLYTILRSIRVHISTNTDPEYVNFAAYNIKTS
jgi:hypothetical protein